jgi:hypothetical protein
MSSAILLTKSSSEICGNIKISKEKIMLINDNSYLEILSEIKSQINNAQRNAIFAVNNEAILLYWNIGKIINSKSEWGNKSSVDDIKNRIGGK